MADDKLLKILFEKSFKYDPDFGFTLASGAKSDIYVDVKRTVLSSEGIDLIGEAMYEKLKDIEFDGIGGLTLGADPISYSTALICKQKGKPVEVYIVRKEPKKHGTARPIEGNLTEGAKVVVVDDVDRLVAGRAVVFDRPGPCRERAEGGDGAPDP